MAHDLRGDGARLGGTYRASLASTGAAAAVPYGYTALNAAAGGVLIRTHGPPTLVAALLFLCGAVAGYTAVGAFAASGGPRPAAVPSAPAPWVGLSSGAGAGAGFAGAALIAHALGGAIAFGAAALTATSVYFGVAALGPALMQQHRARGGARRQPVTRAMAGVRPHRNERRRDVHPD